MFFFSYILIILMIFFGVVIVFNANVLISLLTLIFIFICNFLLFIVVGVEFLAFLFLIVYIGAISILFLFVIMLLDIRYLVLQNIFFKYFSMVFLLLFFFLFFIIFFFIFEFDNLINSIFFYEENIYYFLGLFKTNLHLFGYILYNHFFFLVFFLLFYLLIVLLIILLFIYNKVFLDYFFTSKKIIQDHLFLYS